MEDYDLKVPSELLSNLFSEKDGLTGILEHMMNGILEAQTTEQIGADHYERSDDRQGYCNGYHLRESSTRG